MSENYKFISRLLDKYYDAEINEINAKITRINLQNRFSERVAEAAFKII